MHQTFSQRSVGLTSEAETSETRELVAGGGGYLWRSMWICSSVSSRSTVGLHDYDKNHNC